MPRLPLRPALGAAPKCGNPAPRPGMAPSQLISSRKNRKETPRKAQAECRASAQSHSHQFRTQPPPPPAPAGEGKWAPTLTPATTFPSSSQRPLPPGSPAAPPARTQPPQLCSPPIAPSRPTARKKTALRKEGERWGQEGCWAAAGVPPQWPQLLKPISCLYLLVRMLALRVSLESTVCSPRRW